VEVSIEATRRLKRPPATDRALKGHDKNNDNQKNFFFFGDVSYIQNKTKIKVGDKKKS
jgi:hypothetical protein